MKTNSVTENIKDRPISKTLEEVWEWKEKVYQDTKDMTFKEQQEYFWKSMERAAKILNAKIVKNADGSYSFVKNNVEKQ